MHEQSTLQALEEIGAELQQRPKESFEKIDRLLNRKDSLSREIHLKAIYYKGCAMAFIENFQMVKSLGYQLKEASERLQDEKNMIHSYNLIAIAYDHLNDYYNALHYFKKGYAHARSLKDSKMIAIQAMNLCDILTYLEFHENARNFAYIALEHAGKTHHQRLRAKAYIRLSHLYFRKKDLGNSLSALKEGEKHMTSKFPPVDHINYHLTRSAVLLHLHNHAQAKYHLEQGENFLKSINSTRMTILVNTAYSDYEKQWGSMSRAKKRLLEALGLSEKFNNHSLELLVTSKLSDLYADLGERESENDFLKRCIALKSERYFNLCHYDGIQDAMDNDETQKICASLMEENTKLKAEAMDVQQRISKEQQYLDDWDAIMLAPSYSRVISLIGKIGKEQFPSTNHGLYYFNPYRRESKDLLRDIPVNLNKQPALNEALKKIPALWDPEMEKGTYDFFKKELDHDMGLFCMNAEGDLLILLFEDLSLLRLPEYVEKSLQRVLVYLLHLMKIQNLSQCPSPALENIHRFNLTKNEKAIASYVCRGMSNKEIAQAFNISTYTIRNQLSTIFEKMGVSNRYQVISKLFDISEETFSATNFPHRKNGPMS